MQPADHSTPDPAALGPAAMAALQRSKLAAMLAEIGRSNGFYQRKLAGASFDARHDDLATLPLTTRAEIEQDQLASPPYGTNLTYPLTRYARFHQTSGTGGRPVRWLDTAESWAWFGRCWGIILEAAGARPGDRMLFPFSFGPFVGFWAAFESAAALGYLCLPAGGMSTTARLRMLIENEIDMVFCTPTYALHMAEVAAAEGIDLAGAKVRALVVAGEPGGSIPAVRGQIEAAWGARVFDHNGMTEMGAVGFECQEAPGGLHVIESEFIAEVIDPATGSAVAEGQTGELVLTNLGRWGSPLIRYRTGDLVRLSRGRCACGRCFARLEGGILGRVDDMFIVRGNNVFPTAVEAVLRRFPEIAEFRICVLEEGSLTQVRLEIEAAPAPGSENGGGNGRGDETADGLAARVGRAVQERLSFRAEVVAVPSGTLPRFEMKARRLVRQGRANADRSAKRNAI